MTRLRLNPEVRVSDLITAASVAVAAVVFVVAQLRERGRRGESAARHCHGTCGDA